MSGKIIKVKKRFLLFSWKAYLKTTIVFMCFSFRSFFTLQSLAVTIPDRTFILGLLLPVGHNIVTISSVMCVILSVMLHPPGKAAF